MKLTPEAREWITHTLGAAEAAKHIAAVDAGEGLPARTVSPVKLPPNFVDYCVSLGMDRDHAQDLIRKTNAQAEDFGLDARERAEQERANNARRQREHRERRGDDYKADHARYMREYRKRK